MLKLYRHLDQWKPADPVQHFGLNTCHRAMHLREVLNKKLPFYRLL